MKRLAFTLIPLALLAETISTVVIVPAALRDAANALAEQEFQGGPATFTAALVTPPATNTITHYWCATPFSATNRAKLNVLTNTPPFAGVTLVLDYDLTNAAAPFAFLATNGLAVYAPPMFPAP